MSIYIYKRRERAITTAVQTGNLRAHLRDATANAHDLLDHAMRAASGWAARSDYARFLTLQYAARKPVEDWLARYASDEVRPPAQCSLIEGDLDLLGCELPRPAASFAISPVTSGDDHALGVAWVLAGSSLGNRSILKEVKRISASNSQADWPHAFLADEAMFSFWKELRVRIERPADALEVTSASRAATAVFDHFLAVTAMEPASV